MNYPYLKDGEYSFNYLKKIYHGFWMWIYTAAEVQGFDLWVDLSRNVVIIKNHG